MYKEITKFIKLTDRLIEKLEAGETVDEVVFFDFFIDLTCDVTVLGDKLKQPPSDFISTYFRRHVTEASERRCCDAAQIDPSEATRAKKQNTFKGAIRRS